MASPICTAIDLAKNAKSWRPWIPHSQADLAAAANPNSPFYSDEEKRMRRENDAAANAPRQRNEDEIRAMLQREKGSIRVEGWKAWPVDDQNVLVEYIITNGSGEPKFWAFEVNLAAKIVRVVVGDPELERKYISPSRRQ
jgi:hypothetical protein